VYATIQELLTNLKGKADAIVIPTPIATHFEIAKQCLEAGFHIILEKPPVATIQDLDELVIAAENSGKIVAVCFHSLYSAIMQEIKRRVCNGTLGAIKRVKARAAWVRTDEYYARSSWAGKIIHQGKWVLDGTINNPLAHMLADELFLASTSRNSMAMPVRVTAELYHAHQIETEDTSCLRIITEDGVEVLFYATLCPAESTSVKVSIEAENATVEYENFNRAVIRYTSGREEIIQDESEQRIYMLEQMIKCIESGKTNIITPQMCRPFTLAVNGAFDSSGRVYEIPQEYIQRSGSDDKIKTVIKDIDQVMINAYKQNKLFSEMGLPWSHLADEISIKDYNYFPSRNFTNHQLSERQKEVG
jgi:predicted dehydrogenase